MRRIFFKCSFFIICLVVSSRGVSQQTPPVGLPPGHECCEDLAPASGQLSDASPEYLACIEDPTDYCTVPIDNSLYIYISMVAAVAIASFVLVRRIKT